MLRWVPIWSRPSRRQDDESEGEGEDRKQLSNADFRASLMPFLQALPSPPRLLLCNATEQWNVRGRTDDKQ